MTPGVGEVTGSAGLGTEQLYRAASPPRRRLALSQDASPGLRATRSGSVREAHSLPLARPRYIILQELFLPFDDASGVSPPASFGNYRVLHQIGSGVLGPVFRAYDSQTDRLVAIKTFRLDLVPEDAARLAERLRGLAETPVAHPAIVAAVDAGLSGATPFVALEYAGGESLDIASRSLKAWTLARALPVLDELAHAIDASWGQSIGHGALHPRDIFVPAGASALQITGFGIGQALDAISAKPPLRRPYSAPERAAGGAWDRRADIYSLGVIAHEMLSGHRLVGLEHDAGVEGVAEELPTAGLAAVRKALAKAMSEAPADRFATATEFTAALGTALTGTTAEPAESVVAAVPVEPVAPVEPVLVLPRPDPSTVAAPDRRYGIDPPPMFGQADWRRESPEPADSSFPWAATAAVLTAGLVLGGVIGYQVGWNRGNAATLAPAALTTTQEIVSPPAPIPPPEPVTTTPTPNVAATPTPASASSPVKAAPTGRLVIQSTPSGALVTVDGQRAGETPLTVTVPLGRHEVQVARSGYVPRTDRVDLSAKQPSRTLRVPLRRGSLGDSPASAMTGSVDVDSRPRGARVSVDGRALGSTPLRVPELSAGDHRVLVELAGYRTVTSMVNIVSGESTRLTLTLVEGRFQGPR